MHNISDTYNARRHRLMTHMQQGIAIIPTASEVGRNGDAYYPFRFDSYFHYLTGFEEAEAVLVLVANPASNSTEKNNPPQSILFCLEKNHEREIWDGFRYGPAAAREKFGFNAAFPIGQLDEKLTELMGNQNAIYYPLGLHDAWDKRVLALRAKVLAQVRNGIAAPHALQDVRLLLDEMRLIKDHYEIDTMRRAAHISAMAHVRAMRAACPGMMEYEIEAELLYEFRKNGAQAPAYTSIVASGENACVLHYINNNAPLRDGDLLLIDAACELQGYASDITRTFPVNGKFTAAQKDVYEIVLAAQLAAIAAARPT